MTTLEWLKQEADRAILRGYHTKAAHLTCAAGALSAIENKSVAVLIELEDRAVKCDACGIETRVPALSCDSRLLRVEVKSAGQREVRFACHNCAHIVKAVF